MSKKVAQYARYSTHTQDGNFSIDIQMERMKAACVSKGWQFDDDSVFIDAAYSGANMDRPALQDLLSRLNEFDVVMVYRLDRLSRSQRDTMTLIQDHFLKNDVAFVSVSETLDTTTPFGMAMIGILAVFAELERATITERMQSGIKKKVAAGYRINGGDRPPTGYAYEKTENGLVLIPNKEADLVRKMYDYYEQYNSITQVQYKLKEEGYSKRKFGTIRQILSNRLYIGEVVYLNESYKGIHEPLITIEQFDRVQAILDSRPKGANYGKNKESLFGSLITCGHCGEPYTTYSYKVKNKKKGDYYVRSYICKARRLPGEYDTKCMNQSIKDAMLMKKFIFAMNDFLTKLEFDVMPSSNNNTNYDLAIKRIDEKIARLFDLYEDGEIDKATLNKRIVKRNEEKKELLDRQKSEKQNKAIAIDLSDLKESVINLPEMAFANKRALVEKVLEGIVIDGDDVIFDFR